MEKAMKLHAPFLLQDIAVEGGWGMAFLNNRPE